MQSSRIHNATLIRVGLGGEMLLPDSATQALRIRPFQCIWVVEYADGRVELCREDPPGVQPEP